MSSLTLAVFSILMILICTVSTVSSDCSSCCLLGTGCSTAYNGIPGQCCAHGLTSFCCPTSSVCSTNYECRLLYWGMPLAVLIGVIAGVIVVGTLLIALCCRLCRSRPVTHAMILTPTYHNPAVYHAPPPVAVQYKY